MGKIVAVIGKDLYRTEIRTETNTIISDEPISLGGKDLGFSPEELLASSLAACTCATLRMYADRKEWDLKEVNVEITFGRDPKEHKSVLERKIYLSGDLNEDQKSRLMSIATRCPIHKVLTGSIEIKTIAS